MRLYARGGYGVPRGGDDGAGICRLNLTRFQKYGWSPGTRKEPYGLTKQQQAIESADADVQRSKMEARRAGVL